MYQLYIANKNYSSWSLRPWLLLRALAIPFNQTLVPFSSGIRQSAFKVFSPTGKVPCLVDGARTIWDSLAIVEYVAEDHPQVWPADRQARAWARCAAAEMHSGFGALRSQCPMNCGVRIKLAAVSDELRQDIARLDELWQQGLTRFGGPFLAGARFSAADAFFAPVVFRLQTYGLPVSAASQAWCQNMLSLPALKQWYADALAEEWRETQHEAETADIGEVISDLRAS
ncbi:glutathione S-transferase family protein [Affinibrenneria salicis]|uniref:Glutathione S-transferase family protein n=1 Tax=Affinibrenneria salicis TaxID=2590031 RepID=A0A5J5G1S5_9GAMM|nr:glutathione S-transferase family protein [Affinibrenneria salicis]KAA9000608.1 glutathione S-transferase family protein [Affinibrenneria salicis]